MKELITALIVSTLGTTAMAQGMYTCTVDGKKVIQDRPCALIQTTKKQPMVEEKTAKQIQAEFDAEIAEKREQERRSTEAEAKRANDAARKQQALADAQQACREGMSSPAVVTNSAWDGSVSEVKKYLNTILKDPSSFEAIKWGNVVRTCDGYTVFLTYRARNGFGGMTITTQVFFMDKMGNVVSVER